MLFYRIPARMSQSAKPLKAPADEPDFALRNPEEWRYNEAIQNRKELFLCPLKPASNTHLF